MCVLIAVWLLSRSHDKINYLKKTNYNQIFIINIPGKMLYVSGLISYRLKIDECTTSILQFLTSKSYFILKIYTF